MAERIDLEELTRLAKACPFTLPGGYCAACQNGLHRCTCLTRAYYRNAVHDPRGILALLQELAELRAQAQARAATTEATDPESWWYAQSSDAENWDMGGSTREEAIAEGRGSFPGEAFYVTQGERPTAAQFAEYFDAQRALEDMIDYGTDNGLLGEDTELEFSDEAACEREVKIAIARHLVRPNWWAMLGDAERIEPIPSPPEEL
jgi:hypothetical protein